MSLSKLYTCNQGILLAVKVHRKSRDFVPFNLSFQPSDKNIKFLMQMLTEEMIIFLVRTASISPALQATIELIFFRLLWAITRQATPQ
jgi:hypothetical protein